MEAPEPCTSTQFPTSVGIAFATSGLSEIRYAKKLIPGSEDPALQ
jgi:hypothetical protein